MKLGDFRGIHSLLATKIIPLKKSIFTRPMMIVFLSALLIAIISFPISSALYDPSKEMKLMTEDEWPSHGPWIVTVGD